MADILDSCEVYDCITNDRRSLLSCCLRTHGIRCSHKHRDRNLFDASDVYEGHLLLALLPVGCIFLEPIRIVGVLPPVELVYNGYRLEGTTNHIASFLAQLITNLAVVLVPAHAITIEAVDADILEIV